MALQRDLNLVEEVRLLRDTLREDPPSVHSEAIELWCERLLREYPHKADVIRSVATTLHVCGIEKIAEDAEPAKNAHETNALDPAAPSLKTKPSTALNWLAIGLSAIVLPLAFGMLWFQFNKIFITLVTLAVLGVAAYHFLPGWIAQFWPRMTVATGLSCFAPPFLSVVARFYFSFQQESEQFASQQTLLAGFVMSAAETPWQVSVVTIFAGCFLTRLGLTRMNPNY